MVPPTKLSAAEIQFKKAKHATEGKPLLRYEADAITVGRKTERLKALRLAREAEEAAMRPAAPVRKRRTTKAKAVKADEGAATLSGWWKDQREDGR